MIPLLKLRGFWDSALFVLIGAGVLSVLFWLEASDRVSWADATLAFASAMLIVFGIILARRGAPRGEKPPWIRGLTWRVDLMATLVAFTLIFGAIYADAYLLHRSDITARRFWDDVVLFAMLATAEMVVSSLRRAHARRHVL